MTPNQIDMFAKADKIQEAWEPEVGDRVVHKGYQEVEFIRDISKDGRLIVGFCIYMEKERTIFLPSIEQMAGMWHPTPGGIFIVDLAEFYRKGLLGKITGFKSDWPLQIIVLAFIQHDLHGLVWSEKAEVWE